jgi:cytochrome c-type biogenesis protein CcmE
MTRRKRRLTLIGLAGTVLAVAAGLVLYALTDRIVFFNSPSDIRANAPAPGQRVRLGGLVSQGSVVKGTDGSIAFEVTDGNAAIKVAYRGILPDLFREGQGVVTEGIVEADGSFAADTVLAKHDENYMPKEVADALKKQGVWRHTEDAAPGAATQ